MKIGKFFEKYFVHIFISGTHFFFIGLSVWLDRYDLFIIGMIMFFVSFVAFEFVGRYGTKNQNHEITQD